MKKVFQCMFMIVAYYYQVLLGSAQPNINLYFSEEEVKQLASFEPKDLIPYHTSENWNKDMERMGLPRHRAASTDFLDMVMKLNNLYPTIPNAIGIYYTSENLDQLYHAHKPHVISIHALGGNPWRETLGDSKLFEAFHENGILQERLVELDLSHAILVKSTYKTLAEMRNLRKLAMPKWSSCLYDDEFVFPPSIEQLVIYNARIDSKLGAKFKDLKNLKKLTLVGCYVDLPKLPDGVDMFRPLRSITDCSQELHLLQDYDPLGYVRPRVEELVLLGGRTGGFTATYVWENLTSLTTDFWLNLDIFWVDNPNLIEPSMPKLKNFDVHLDESTKENVMEIVFRWFGNKSGMTPRISVRKN